ncbi:MAG: hypothetical protein R3327_00670 [Nitrosopumilaceae archaeon]|nr:hypothetical protein [Nitrosopumilaceae archaeon]
MDRIKRLSFKVLDKHKSQFGENFDENKEILDKVTIIRSKGLKNEIAGFITKFLKKEKRNEETKQAQIDAMQEEDVLDNPTSDDVTSEDGASSETTETSSTEKSEE